MKTAKLSSDLLVQKGMANPTGGYSDARTTAEEPLALLAKPAAGAGQEGKSVREQSEALLKAFAGAPKRSRRVNLSFRMDPQRHHRLKVAAAHMNRSAQDILTNALDRYLDEMAGAYMDGSCNCLSAETDTDRPHGAQPARVAPPNRG
jgi:hypothetical protein